MMTTIVLLGLSIYFIFGIFLIVSILKQAYLFVVYINDLSRIVCSADLSVIYSIKRNTGGLKRYLQYHFVSLTRNF